MSTTRRILLLAHVPLFVWWGLFSWLTFDGLPSQVPIHFDVAGRPDGFYRSSVIIWFGFPILGLLTSALTIGAAEFSARNPKLWNVPQKRRFLELSPEEQAPLIENLYLLMTLVSIGVSFMLAALHYDMWRVAHGLQTGLSFLSFGAMIVVIGGTLIGVPIWMVQFSRRLQR